MRWAILLSVPLIWGSYAPIFKYALPRTLNLKEMIIIANFCSIISCIVFAPVFVMKRFRQTSSEDCFQCIMIGILLFGGQITQLTGLSHTSASTNAILVQTSCVCISIYNCKKTGRFHVLTSILAIIGAYITVNGDNQQDDFLGVCWTLLSAGFYACHTIAIGKTSADFLVQTVIQLLILALGNIFVLIGMLAFTYNFVNLNRIQNINTLLLIAWNSLAGTAWTTFAMSYAQTRINSTIAGLVYATEPVFAILFSLCIFNETIYANQWFGVVMIVVANFASIYVDHEEIIEEDETLLGEKLTDAVN